MPRDPIHRHDTKRSEELRKALYEDEMPRGLADVTPLEYACGLPFDLTRTFWKPAATPVNAGFAVVIDLRRMIDLGLPLLREMENALAIENTGFARKRVKRIEEHRAAFFPARWWQIASAKWGADYHFTKMRRQRANKTFYLNGVLCIAHSLVHEYGVETIRVPQPVVSELWQHLKNEITAEGRKPELKPCTERQFRLWRPILGPYDERAAKWCEIIWDGEPQDDFLCRYLEYEMPPIDVWID